MTDSRTRPRLPCVVAIIKGGLGNQLFAYAGARAYSLRTRRQLYLDNESGFELDGYGRTFRLDRFPVVAEPAPASLRLGSPRSFKHRWVRGMDRLLPRILRCYFAERQGGEASDLLRFQSRRAVVYLNGYWQDPSCFESQALHLREELEPPTFETAADRKLEEEIAATESVFIHVRRNRYSPRLGAGYYASAISRASDTLTSPRFEVFGDDPEWAAENLDFGRLPVRFHQPADDELRDFRLMAACQHAIVANSSFSWWAAWLRDHARKKVWTPAEPGWPVKPASSWIRIPNRLERQEQPPA